MGQTLTQPEAATATTQPPGEQQQLLFSSGLYYGPDIVLVPSETDSTAQNNDTVTSTTSTTSTEAQQDETNELSPPQNSQGNTNTTMTVSGLTLQPLLQALRRRRLQQHHQSMLVQDVPIHQALAHIQKESVLMSTNENGGFHVSVDAERACRLKVLVPNQNDNLYEIDVQSGLDQLVNIPVDVTKLAIVEVQLDLTANFEKHVHSTYVQYDESVSLLKVMKQTYQVDTVTYTIQDIFGLSDASSTDTDCIVCLSAPKNTVLLPCRHWCMCDECADALSSHIPDTITTATRTDTQCPICRRSVIGCIKVEIPRAEE